MKNLILTSCGIIDEKLKKYFFKLIDKKAEDLRVLYIPIAADVEKGNKSWIKEEFNTILNLGIREENILEYKMNYDINIKDFDLIYMLGGNTFYLLKKIKETNFDRKIKEALENGIIYVGSSAGSIIMGNTVETSLDDNNNYVNDYTGLKHINGIIIPHANKRKEYIEKQKSKFADTIYTIYDEHGIVLLDDKVIKL